MKYGIEKQNFISADFRSARNSFGEYFTISDVVVHDDDEVGESFIMNFSIDSESNEIIANTPKGWAHIDFLSLVPELELEDES